MNVVLDGRATYPSAVLAMGMFDGVHIGHQVLLKKAKAMATAWGVPLVVCTFEKHPLTLLAPEKVPKRLTTLQERLEQMEAVGVDTFFCMPFGEELLHMPPENYIGELVRRFHPMAIVCGYNHHFGCKGAGTPALLHALGHALDFETAIIPKVTMGEEDVSATKVRQCLSEGKVHKVLQMLQRPYAVRVVQSEEKDYRFADADKQPVAEGIYRAIAVAGEKNIPVHTEMKADGSLSIASSTLLPKELTLRFLSETKKP